MITLIFCAIWLIACASAGVVGFHWLIKYAEHRARKERG